MLMLIKNSHHSDLQFNIGVEKLHTLVNTRIIWLMIIYYILSIFLPSAYNKRRLIYLKLFLNLFWKFLGTKYLVGKPYKYSIYQKNFLNYWNIMCRRQKKSFFKLQKLSGPNCEITWYWFKNRHCRLDSQRMSNFLWEN